MSSSLGPQIEMERQMCESPSSESLPRELQRLLGSGLGHHVHCHILTGLYQRIYSALSTDFKQKIERRLNAELYEK